MSGPARSREPRPAPEALVERTDILRRETSKQLHPERQAEMGQFFTPAPIARLMASMFQAKGKSLRLLDAGAGSGALTGAFIAEMCSKRRPPQEIHVEAYEIDASVVPFLRQSLDLCAVHCRETGTVFTAEVRQEDFIEEGFAALRGGLFTDPRPQFDAAILNPPYRKIDSDSRTRRLFDMLGVGGSSNLYSAFVALALGFLKPHGELVAITPRSFCNGPYFREFRPIFSTTPLNTGFMHSTLVTRPSATMPCFRRTSSSTSRRRLLDKGASSSRPHWGLMTNGQVGERSLSIG